MIRWSNFTSYLSTYMTWHLFCRSSVVPFRWYAQWSLRWNQLRRSDEGCREVQFWNCGKSKLWLWLLSIDGFQSMVWSCLLSSNGFQSMVIIRYGHVYFLVMVFSQWYGHVYCPVMVLDCSIDTVRQKLQLMICLCAEFNGGFYGSQNTQT